MQTAVLICTRPHRPQVLWCLVYVCVCASPCLPWTPGRRQLQVPSDNLQSFHFVSYMGNASPLCWQHIVCLFYKHRLFIAYPSPKKWTKLRNWISVSLHIMVWFKKKKKHQQKKKRGRLKRIPLLKITTTTKNPHQHTDYWKVHFIVRKQQWCRRISKFQNDK